VPGATTSPEERDEEPLHQGSPQPGEIGARLRSKEKGEIDGEQQKLGDQIDREQDRTQGDIPLGHAGKAEKPIGAAYLEG
jgi:hypothetical protein